MSFCRIPFPMLMFVMADMSKCLRIILFVQSFVGLVSIKFYLKRRSTWNILLQINRLLIWISPLLSWKRINFNFSVADHLLADLGFTELSCCRLVWIMLTRIAEGENFTKKQTSLLHWTPLKPFASNCFLNNQLFSWLQIEIIFVPAYCW